MDPGPACGDLGPCPSGSTCVVDPATGESACGMTCNDSIACPDGAMCDPTLGVCVVDPGTGTPSNPTELDVSSDGSCSVSAPKSGTNGGAAAALMLALGALVMRRRR